jgi:hypothetical protein
MDEVLFPRPVLDLLPIVTVWFTHRRLERKEYVGLAASCLIVCLPLLIFAYFCPSVCTWYGGRLAARGISPVQIPLSLFVTPVICPARTRRKPIRIAVYVVAVLVGEILLVDIWIS